MEIQVMKGSLDKAPNRVSESVRKKKEEGEEEAGNQGVVEKLLLAKQKTESHCPNTVTPICFLTRG